MILGLYARAFRILRPDLGRAGALAAANLGLGALAVLEPVLFGRVVDSLTRGAGPWTLVGAWAGLGVISISGAAGVSLLADRMAHRRRLAAMNRAFERAVTLPAPFLSEQGTGRVIRTMLSGGDALFVLILSFFREQQPALFSVVLLIPLAFWIDPVMAAVLVSLAVIYLGVSWLVVGRTEAGQARVEQHHQAVSSRIGDVIANVGVIQAYTRTRAEGADLRAMTSRLLGAQYPVLSWWAVLMVMTRGASTLAMVTLFATGSLLLAAGQVSVGEIVSFIGFAGLLIARLDQLSASVARVFVQAPTLKGLFDLMDTRLMLADAPDAEPLLDIRGEVVFERVSHWFLDSHMGVFDIDLRIPAGAKVALVGASGAGKTTLMSLLQRQREPTVGRVLIDGHDIRRATLASLRSAIGVVFQDAGLFNRSIAENLRLARPAASDAELEAAARTAEAHEFICAKPGGYGFIIGEGGRLLSGGERQRLAIARAILKDAPILILDEATSALDTVTEQKVKRALDAAAAGRTTFVIAHRLSTIMDADLIVVMEKGRIVETGRSDELLARGGAFHALAEQAGLIGKPGMPG
ncbi:ATP-binding cassette domain-containing protein [Brevundimonas sp.]|uniref:ATP-binding cassette domain-containing protein n=1 Tax=Brevundimonas sp. TaxID=1871086 RepID=UPI002D2EB811|nr:ATP-binding cassette domain-containing protein [Brevundimonas sp.]HYD26364.1 ATP-binding cassette domain-containing protein [Brevundimonas sp.]